VTRLIRPASGHQISTDKDSLEFWKAAGYRVSESESKKAPAKKASKKSSK
jgi:hypothetical protein